MKVDALDRLESIRSQLDREGRVRIDTLAAELNVSEMTIRRDLEVLADEGCVHRVRGGAVAIGPRKFTARFGDHMRAKSLIGQKLLDLAPREGAIAVDASTTMQRLAARLGHARDLTVITNGPETFSVLQEHKGVVALLTGGELDCRTGSLVGTLAARAASEIFLSTLFASASALDPVFGSTEATLAEAEIKVAFAASASEIVLAVDASKLGSRALARAFPITSITTLVTELPPDDPRLDPYRESCRII